MKKYYTGSIERLVIKKLNIGDEATRIVQERCIIRKDVLFYKNIMGVVIRFEDKEPMPTYEETSGYMDKYLSESYPAGAYSSGPFFDENQLTRVEMTIAQEKSLIKARKEQRKRTKQSKN